MGNRRGGSTRVHVANGEILHIREFLEDQVTSTPEKFLSRREMWEAYNAWSAARGDGIQWRWSLTRFTRILNENFDYALEQGRIRGFWGWVGVELK